MYIAYICQAHMEHPSMSRILACASFDWPCLLRIMADGPASSPAVMVPATRLTNDCKPVLSLMRYCVFLMEKLDGQE